MRARFSAVPVVFIALLPSVASGEYRSKKGFVVPTEAEAEMTKPVGQELIDPKTGRAALNPKTGRPFTNWREVFDDTEGDLEEDDDDDDDDETKVVSVTAKVSNAGDIFQGGLEAENHSAKRGESLRSLPKQSWFSLRTPGKVEQQQRAADLLRTSFQTSKLRDDEVDDRPDDEVDRALKIDLDRDDSLSFKDDHFGIYRSARKASETRLPPAKCPANLCRATVQKKNHTLFSDDWGDDDIVEVWTRANLGIRTPSPKEVGCGFDWNTGITVLKKKFDIIKIDADLEADRRTNKATGSSGMWLLGKSVYSKKGSFKQENLFSRSVATPRVGLDVSMTPFLTIGGGVSAAATVDFKGSSNVRRSNIAHGYSRSSCSLRFTPGIKASMTGDVTAHVGIRRIVDLVRVSLKGRLTPVNFHLPVTAQAYQAVAGNDEPAGAFSAYAESKADFMAGKVWLAWRIKDACVRIPFFGKKCLLKHVLRIKTSGEKTLWKNKGYDFDRKLIAWNTKLRYRKNGK